MIRVATCSLSLFLFYVSLACLPFSHTRLARLANTTQLFQKHTGWLLRAPGPAVPKVVTLLKEHVSEADHALLLSFQLRVAKLIAEKRKDGGQCDELSKSLEADGEALKRMVKERFDS